MVENLLAFNFSKTRTICDAFDDAWTLLQGLGSDLTQAPKSLATQTILAKRIIVSVRKHFESFESLVIQSGDLMREGHHRCGRRRTADVTTAANCDIRVT